VTGDGAVLIAQISDLHVGIVAGDGALEARHRERLTRAVARVAADVSGLALLVASGDLVDHGAEEEYAFLLELLDSFPAPCLLLPGNHDDAATLATVLGRDSGFDQVADLGALRVVALDSSHPGIPSGRLAPAQLAWLDARLAEDDRPTVLALHHPPLALGNPGMDAMALEEPAALGAVLDRHPHVARIVCGHVHRPVFATFGGIGVAAAPSLAYQLVPDLDGTRGLQPAAEPAGYAVHRWHPADGLSTHVIAMPDPT